MEISGQFHASAALPLGEDLPLQIDKESGCAPRLVCMFCRENNNKTTQNFICFLQRQNMVLFTC